MKPGSIVGVGTGSTVDKFIDALAASDIKVHSTFAAVAGPGPRAEAQPLPGARRRQSAVQVPRPASESPQVQLAPSPPADTRARPPAERAVLYGEWLWRRGGPAHAIIIMLVY